MSCCGGVGRGRRGDLALRRLAIQSCLVRLYIRGDDEVKDGKRYVRQTTQKEGRVVCSEMSEVPRYHFKCHRAGITT